MGCPEGIGLRGYPRNLLWIMPAKGEDFREAASPRQGKRLFLFMSLVLNA